MLVAGVAVTDQDAGEFAEHASGVDVVAGAAADMHHGQVFGAGDMHVGQGARRASAGFVGVQHRRAGQQFPHVGEESLFQFPGGAAPDPGQQPGGHIDSGQCPQQLP